MHFCYNWEGLLEIQMFTHMQNNIYIRSFTTALVVNAKVWKQSKCLSIGKYKINYVASPFKKILDT